MTARTNGSLALTSQAADACTGRGSARVSEINPREDRPLVLIAEDEPDNRDLLQTLAETFLGVRTMVAASGPEVLKAARQGHPNLIILDLMLPVLDGFQVARELKRDPETAGIPIIAVSALARPGDSEAAREAGCDEFVRKPFELDELEQIIRDRLDGLPRNV